MSKKTALTFRQKIGGLLQITQENLGLNNRELAQESQVDVGTISRTHNAKTDITLPTLIRLSDSLKLSLPYIVKITNNQALALTPREEVSAKSETGFTQQTVQRWLEKLRQSPDKTLQTLTQIESVFAKQSTPLQVKTRGRPVNTERKLLLYPLQLSPTDIWELYLHGSPTALVDLGAYLRSWRLTSTQSIGDLATASKINHEVIRQLEGGQVNRVKFEYCITISAQLNNDHQFLQLSWDTISALLKISDLSRIENDLINRLIICERWRQFISPTPEIHEATEQLLQLS